MSVLPVISAWSVVSPLGSTEAEFTANLRAGLHVKRAVDPEQWDVPVTEAVLLDGFDARSEPGRKGTRTMDRATALAVAAVARLLTEPAGGGRVAGVGPDSALVLGTSTGSAQSILDFSCDSLRAEKPCLANPAHFPNTVMNCAAGQCAIWHGLKGPNTTVASGRVSGLTALQATGTDLRARGNTTPRQKQIPGSDNVGIRAVQVMRPASPRTRGRVQAQVRARAWNRTRRRAA